MSTARLESGVERWSALAEGFAEEHDGDGLESLRRTGRESFSFPDTRDEEWQYANLNALAGTEFAPCATHYSGVEDSPAPVVWKALTEEAGRVGELADLKRHPLAALNTALVAGLAARVPDDVALERPMALSFAASTQSAEAVAYAPRLLLEVGRNAQAALIIREELASHHWSNAVVEVFLGENASLDLVFEQRGDGFGTSLICVEQERDSRLRSFVSTQGRKLIRQDLEVGLAGDGANCVLRGLFGATGDGVDNHHTWVDHRLPHCQSDEVYKGVVSDRARGVFRGRVVVRPDAQKTRALQSNPNLLLDSGAEIDTKPQLEIYADDVRCTHGSTVGQLDREALFFLRARGLDPSAAKALLLRGFASSVFEDLPTEALRDELVEDFLDAFGAGK